MREAKIPRTDLLGWEGGNLLDIIDCNESCHCTNPIYYFTEELQDDAAVRRAGKQD